MDRRRDISNVTFSSDSECCIAAILVCVVRGGAWGRIRTTDTRIFNPLLYQLSYSGIASA